jgi:Domain of unknown function (DUF5666)
MIRGRWTAAVALTAALAVAPVLAHEGHVHKVMGTVSSIDGKHVVVKTTDGKSVTVMLDDKTTISRGKDKLDASALKVGERISVDAMQEKDMMMAHAIRLASAAPAPAK